MSKYAVGTKVPIDKSQEEIKRILRKYNCDRFGTIEDKDNAYIMFEYNRLLIRITVPMPKREEFEKTEKGRDRTESIIEQCWDQAIRQRWRALVLNVKAKLEWIDAGMSTVEREFIGNIVMPDGKDLAEHLLPNIMQIVETGKLPKMLTMGEK